MRNCKNSSTILEIILGHSSRKNFQKKKTRKVMSHHKRKNDLKE